jgi:hypothetical protein
MRSAKRRPFPVGAETVRIGRGADKRSGHLRIVAIACRGHRAPNRIQGLSRRHPPRALQPFATWPEYSFGMWLAQCADQ